MAAFYSEGGILSRNSAYSLFLLVNMGLCGVMSLADYLGEAKPKDNYEMVGGGVNRAAEVLAFQRRYLVILGLVYMGDWLQGSYLYALYRSYGYTIEQIGWLFVIGFGSSALFGTYIGSAFDKKGRKLGSIAYCILTAFSCLTKLSPDPFWLVLGRVTGGISTSLLFSVFESWMISTYNAQGLPEDGMHQTFAWATFINGTVAILSGFLANGLVSAFGLTSPFMFAVLLNIVAMFAIQNLWSENYGSNDAVESKPASQVVSEIVNDQVILNVGISQSCFESSMYLFIFLWSPVIESLAADEGGKPNHTIPFGLIFSSFMVYTMMGSLIFKFIKPYVSFPVMLYWIQAISSVLFFVTIFSTSESLSFMCFNLFEMIVGIYFPVIGTLRSECIPEADRSRIMNYFRIPLNIVVTAALLRKEFVSGSNGFALCCGLTLLGSYSAMHVQKSKTPS